ncbi:G-type lectin S-receptor-like serine/threonine-protein kinase LECRK4 [Corylus avellana]|uniref:G-type lectin S-receptor-like serine/threonine-protein kinase LECRK4 n=1 Tax=Corylus avellana TaxID=13451 RepID=UPI00286D056E|nr:G-type lectin S-receptor-like serine/threonine-protein kinase LECRK4 [Corylus avellana]
MAPISIVFFLVFTSFACGGAQPNQSSRIGPGSSLSPTTQPSSWLSPASRFAFGFYQLQGTTGFAVGIWLVSKHNKTVVWTAIRDGPPITTNARLDFTKDGMMLSRTERRRSKLIAKATGSVSYAAMLDSGNFVLCDKDSKIVWQSFEHPTDTILGGQTLFAGGQLFSSLTEIDHSSRLVIINGSSLHTVRTLHIASSATNNNTIYRSTLDADGIFRLYSHGYEESGDFNVSTLWEALTDRCEVKAFCGFNSYCTFNDNEPYCLCLPGTDFVDPNDRSLGCEKNFSEAVCIGGKENEALYRIQTMDNMEWGDLPYVVAALSTKEECSRSCLEDCSCGVAQFKSESCWKQSLPLRYVRRTKNKETVFFKDGITSLKSSNETDNQQVPLEVVRKTAIVEILLVTFGFTAFSCVALAISGLFVFKCRVLRYQRLIENGNLGLNEEVTLRLFSYNELKRATNGFKEELGKGSFGAVYKGALYKGRRLVAVKRLEKLIEEGEREFRAEMRAIGRTHHSN